MDFRQFQLLGDEIRSKLQQADFDELTLPELAAEALAKADLDTDFQLDDVAEFLLTTNIAQQPVLRFSNLPPVVYRCDDFYIELLVWMDATTVIHQHAFSGAFRVFAGSSVHSIYQFHERERISSRFLVGDVRLERVELLRRGDVRQIKSGRQGLVHALFHLDQPSVTLVVRNSEPWARPQYVLARPNVAFADQDLEEDSRVQVMKRLLDAAALLDRERAADLLIRWGSRLDFPRLFKVVKDRSFLLRSKHRWSQFLEVARQSHGHLVEHLTPMARSARRENSIKTTRSSTRDPDLRFFLALLLNVPSRPWMNRLVEARFPSQSPQTFYCQWLKQLGDFHDLARWSRRRRYHLPAKLARAMPFGTEGPRTDAILEAVITGASSITLASRLQRTFHDDGVASAAIEAYDRLIKMDELQPLFAP